MSYLIYSIHSYGLKPLGLGLTCVFWLMLSGVALADSGSMRVTVLNGNDQRPVNDAVVRLTARDGETSVAKVNAQGVVNFADLETGLYNLLVARPGFLSSRSPSVRVIGKKNTAIKVLLSPARGLMEETVVTGTRHSGDGWSSSASRFIDRESLRSSAGSGSDILRALDGLPGLFSDGEFASFTVRGNGPRDNLILVDGIPFDKVVHFDDSFGEQEDIEGGGRYSVFAPNLISGAEFYPGGWSAAYGGRSGSLLKLNVAEANPDTASYTTRLDLAGIEVGYDGPSIVDENTSVLFSARRLNFGQLFETIGVDDLGEPKLTDIIVKSTSQLGADDTLNILGIYAPETFVRDIDNVLASDEDEPGNFEDIELVNSETSNTLLAFTWTRLLGDNGQWVNQIYHRYFDENSTTGEAFPDLVPLGTAAGEVPVRENIVTAYREESEYGLRSDYSFNNALGRLSAGIRLSLIDLTYAIALDDDWIRYVYDQNDFRADPQQRFVVLTPETVDNVYAQKGNFYAAYIDQTLEYDQWQLRAGVRFDRDPFSDERLLSPRFGATWQVSDDLIFSANTGIYYQAARFSDRAIDQSNASLQNEKLTQISVGLKYYPFSNIELLLEPYFQKQARLAVPVDGVNQTVSNSGEGRSYGVDAGISRQFDNGWSAHMNYSYNHAETKDSAELAFYKTDFNRPHYIGIGGVWELNVRWKFSARWKWASGVPRDEFIIFDDVLSNLPNNRLPVRFAKEVVSTNTERYGSFNSLNFRADYRRAFGRTNLIAFIDIINVLGGDNPSTSEFNERSGIDVIERGESLPLIGLRLEW